MAGNTGVSRGPEAVESLFGRAGLTEREADAARTVALLMTAAEAAPLMGVSASTVGSYRQRAFAKLGVSGRGEFLRLPAVAAWRGALEEAQGEEGARRLGPRPEEAAATEVPLPPSADEAGPTGGEKSRRSPCKPGRPPLFRLACGVLVAAVLALGVVLLCAHGTYATSSHGVVVTDVGEVPDVVGMRADAAASELANEGYLPVFASRSSERAVGTVLEVGDTGDVDDVEVGVSSFCWGEGCTAGYDVAFGDWDAYVELVVAV